MKSKLNDNGVYINNTIVEIEKDASHKIIIRTANCDDGCRCSIGFRWNTYNKQSIVTINSKPYSSEREAFMRNQIWKRVCVHGGGTGGNYLKYTPLLTQASAIYFKLLSVYRVSENLEMLEIFNKLTQSEQFRHSYRAIKYHFDKKYKFIS